MKQVPISIILCTRNRGQGLRATLESLGRVHLAPEWCVQLIVVDNGSTDDTALVVKGTKLKNIEVRYLLEPRKGKGFSLNTGLAQARSDIILFTDDDVLVAEDWVSQMMVALQEDGFDAVTGKISLAQHLIRPWFTPLQKMWLALNGDAEPCEGSPELVGANMGFRRSVLERVPAFDPELGPGALGLGEDTLLGWQLVEAGYKVGYAPKAAVIHQFDVSRLKRRNWLEEARKHGRSKAYLLYHWDHVAIKSPRWRRMSCQARLLLRRRLQPPPSSDAEGCPLWEMSYVRQIELCRQFARERKREPNYSRRGLVKRYPRIVAATPQPPHS